jgi:hypothetical protein
VPKYADLLQNTCRVIAIALKKFVTTVQKCVKIALQNVADMIWTTVNNVQKSVMSVHKYANK